MSARDILISVAAVFGVAAFLGLFFRSIIVGYLAGGGGGGGAGGNGRGGVDLGPGGGNDGRSDAPLHHDSACDSTPSDGDCGGGAGD